MWMLPLNGPIEQEDPAPAPNLTIGQLRVGETDYPYYGYSDGTSVGFPYEVGSAAGIDFGGHAVLAFYEASGKNVIILAGDARDVIGKALLLEGEPVATIPAEGGLPDAEFTSYDNDETTIYLAAVVAMDATTKGSSINVGLGE